MEGGKEEGFVKCNKSCLYVCCKKENKKNDLKKKVRYFKSYCFNARYMGFEKLLEANL